MKTRILRQNTVSSALALAVLWKQCTLQPQKFRCPIWTSVSALHTSALFTESLTFFLKYADDVLIGHACSDPQGLSISNNAFKYVSEWSGENSFNLNPNKCDQCVFSLKENDFTDPD